MPRLVGLYGKPLARPARVLSGRRHSSQRKFGPQSAHRGSPAIGTGPTLRISAMLGPTWLSRRRAFKGRREGPDLCFGHHRAAGGAMVGSLRIQPLQDAGIEAYTSLGAKVIAVLVALG
jgi:hypothetical protein